MKRSISLGALLLATFGTGLIVTALTGAGTTSAQRLPDAVTPESYDMKFTPDLPTATFTGRRDHPGEPPESTDHIVLERRGIGKFRWRRLPRAVRSKPRR